MKLEGTCKMKWTLYITLASLFIFISFTELGPFKTVFSSHIEEPSQKYVIVFDGGSTGTRVHVFSFVNSSSGLLTLKNEYFEEVKPGLSNFADKPRKAANSVSHLLEKAKSFVPSDNWDETPVVLKATAGLRLLPSHLSNSILDEVSKTLKMSPFLSDEKSVSVLDGEDEGLYAWYTLNFLLGRLNEPSRSVAALDLGGGSTQVTFTPTELDTLVFSPKEYIVSTKVQNKTMSIYTHSYLGLGLMAARLAILKLSGEKIETENQVSFASSCIEPSMHFNWKYDQHEYIISGREDEKFGFKDCYDKALVFLGDSVDQPDELWKREIYALSYYFDRAVDLGIVGEGGGLCTVGEYMDACKKACGQKVRDSPFLCLDCSYISALMHHGLGFDKKKEVQLVQQIDGIETSWGLGAAFNMLV